MSTTFAAIVTDLLNRLGDAQEQIWSATEAGVHVVNGYQQIATQQTVFYDWAYLENLATTFSYTAPWEQAYGYVAVDCGVANYTLDDERLKQRGGGNYFEELLARIRDIRSSEKVFWRKVLEIYATSIDYDPSTEASQQFFATVQNKMH